MFVLIDMGTGHEFSPGSYDVVFYFCMMYCSEHSRGAEFFCLVARELLLHECLKNVCIDADILHILYFIWS